MKEKHKLDILNQSIRTLEIQSRNESIEKKPNTLHPNFKLRNLQSPTPRTDDKQYNKQQWKWQMNEREKKKHAKTPKEESL